MFNDTPIWETRGPWNVPIQIGGSLILLPLLLVSFHGSAREMQYDLAFVAMLIGSILLHELGHAWGCLIQGVPVKRIMLYGGGGFCEATRSTTRSEDELIVAMGPIVNLVIWAVASLIAPQLDYGPLAWGLYTLAHLNIFLALLNLLPVHPLDGGRLFRLALARVMPADLATRVAGGVGLLIAVLWIPLMLICYAYIGFVLLFLPPIGVHWRMLQRQRA